MSLKFAFEWYLTVHNDFRCNLLLTACPLVSSLLWTTFMRLLWSHSRLCSRFLFNQVGSQHILRLSWIQFSRDFARQSQSLRNLDYLLLLLRLLLRNKTRTTLQRYLWSSVSSHLLCRNSLSRIKVRNQVVWRLLHIVGRSCEFWNRYTESSLVALTTLNCTGSVVIVDLFDACYCFIALNGLAAWFLRYLFPILWGSAF